MWKRRKHLWEFIGEDGKRKAVIGCHKHHKGWSIFTGYFNGVAVVNQSESLGYVKRFLEKKIKDQTL